APRFARPAGTARAGPAGPTPGRRRETVRVLRLLRPGPETASRV
ncbi:MAG: hypothetical protein AVDCRST_MAG33-1160, partial [uncultured Thermomicrobiales bacterium]